MRNLALLALTACTSITQGIDPTDLRGKDDVHVKTPKGWDFLFAMDLSQVEAAALDTDFSVASGLVKELGADTSALDNVLVFAKVEEIPGYGDRLRFATKGSFADESFHVDRSAEVLGPVSGSLGEGLYAVYHARHRVGFITGEVSGCDGESASDALVTATGSPFFTRSRPNGQWGVPAVTVNTHNAADAGVPVTIHFDDGDCTGDTSVGTGGPKNPKTGDMPYNEKETDDGTTVIEIPEVDLGDDHGGWTPPSQAEDYAFIDFEDGLEGDMLYGEAIDCQVAEGDPTVGIGVLDTAYATLFEAGQETRFLWMSTGGEQQPRASVKCHTIVPDTATTLEVAYNFVSQEYPEWVGSGYNDTFSVTLAGSPESLIHRTINNAAEDDLWIDAVDAVPDLGDIAYSADALYNGEGSRFDGMLRSDQTGPELGEALGISAFDISEFAGTEITIILTVNDVGDYIYDSGVAVDGIYLY